ncbi:helix-turn-helix transcriptional regulator [Micromonospora maritima]|uniref:helix-turn-helix transcriptional regulator n=1 Tax=Micromonospora maritima TaxID=986711 RepID=UPI0037BD4211
MSVISGEERRRAELREFLRSRRAGLTPGDVGLPDAGRRRTPGLRREELAMLAGVGVSWYTWLEQGRDIKVSESVLSAVGRALRLDTAETAHLFRLAGLTPAATTGGRLPPSERLIKLLDAWAPRPAYVRDRYWNFVAINEPARLVFGFGKTDHNCLVSLFTNPLLRTPAEEWMRNAANAAAAFRADAARYPEDPEFERIAAELSGASPEFAAMWATHNAGEHTYAVKAVDHPRLGLMVFDATLLPLPEHPGHHLILHNPHPGTEERLRSLVVAHPG